MDHAATVSVQFRASVSQADELCETPAAGLTLSEDRPDEVLFEHIARGTQEALAVLFRRYARRIRNIGWRILRDAGEADDLVQEVFLYVFRKGRLYNPSKGPARSWLIQVAYTQALLRRRALNSHGFYAPAGTDRPAETEPSFVQGTHHDYTVEDFSAEMDGRRSGIACPSASGRPYGYISMKAARSRRSLKSWANPTLTFGITTTGAWRSFENMRMRMD